MGRARISICLSGGAQDKVVDGSSTSFWNDYWLGKTPLRLKYPNLYSYCCNRKATVRDYFMEGDWVIALTRVLTLQT